MRVTKCDLEQLDYYILDAVHGYGQDVTFDVLAALYKWCNRICPGFEHREFGVWPPPRLP